VQSRGSEAGNPEHSAESHDASGALDRAEESSSVVCGDAKAAEVDVQTPEDREEDAHDGEEKPKSVLELHHARPEASGDGASSGTIVSCRWARRTHPAAVDLGTPTMVAIEMSPVSWTSQTSR